MNVKLKLATQPKLGTQSTSEGAGSQPPSTPLSASKHSSIEEYCENENVGLSIAKDGTAFFAIRAFDRSPTSKERPFVSLRVKEYLPVHAPCGKRVPGSAINLYDSPMKNLGGGED